MVALMIVLIYYGQTLDQDGVMNINGVIFICLTNMTFQNVFAVINVSEFEYYNSSLLCCTQLMSI